MSANYPHDHDRLGKMGEPEHDPDPMWDLEDMGEDDDDDPSQGPRIPLWVIIVAVLIALALLAQLGWPLLVDFLDRGAEDSRGFPTPGPV